MLSEDFLEPDWTNLDRSLKFLDLVDGMAPNANQKKIANVQYYFVDCCRNAPPDIISDNNVVRGTFLDQGNGADLRAKMTFFAAVDGGTAVSRNGKLTYFGEMLLEAVTKNASTDKQPGPNNQAEPQYAVTGSSLQTYFARQTKKRKLNPIRADVDYGRDGEEAVLCWLNDTPLIDIILYISDAEFQQDALITLKKFDTDPIIMNKQPVISATQILPVGQHLFKDLPIGMYEILVSSSSHNIPTLTFNELQMFDQKSPLKFPLDIKQFR